MPREIKMPKLSDTMEEGTINVWRKREGDRIERGDILVEVETDKADMEFEAYMAGTLAKVLIHPGETVAVGTPIAVVRLDGDSDAELEAFLAKYAGAGGAAVAAPAAATATTSGPPAAAAAPGSGMAGAAGVASAPVASGAQPVSGAPPAPSAPPAAVPSQASAATLVSPTSSLPFFLPDPDRVRATPRARTLASDRGVDLSEIAGSGPDGAIRVSDVVAYLEMLEAADEPALEGDVPVTPVAQRIAEELHIDLSRVKGTGPGGRITKRDLRGHLERASRGSPDRELQLYGDEIKLSQKRKFLIRNMIESKKSTPHFYISMDVDVEPLDALRDRLKKEGKHFTYTHLMVKAAALALEGHPEVNATFRDDRIVRFNPINVAVAVAVQDELVAPVVKDCQGRLLEDLAEATDTLIQKAREKHLAPDDYADGTFTISNLGMFGVEHFYAIITPPQSTVLSVSALRRIPIVENDEIRIGRRMTIGLAVDHRVLDGVKASQFLAELRRILENPEELLESPDSDRA